VETQTVWTGKSEPKSDFPWATVTDWPGWHIGIKIKNVADAFHNIITLPLPPPIKGGDLKTLSLAREEGEGDFHVQQGALL